MNSQSYVLMTLFLSLVVYTAFVNGNGNLCDECLLTNCGLTAADCPDGCLPKCKACEACQPPTCPGGSDEGHCNKVCNDLCKSTITV